MTDADAKAERAKRYALREALKVVLGTPQGALVVQHVLELARAGQRVPYGNTTFTHVEIGRQEVGHDVLDLVREANPAAPALIERQYRETMEDAEERARKDAPPGVPSDWTDDEQTP